MVHLPRGIAADLLLSQVNNTMPYLFDPEVGPGIGPEIGDTPLARFRPAQVVTEFSRALALDPKKTLSHFEYFQLCVSSHYLTCATPVPTDVDNQIRKKLWPAELPLEIALQMADFVLESRKWDFTVVTNRFVGGARGGPWEREFLSGHNGEWFTIAAGAYCALKLYADPAAEQKREEVCQAVSDEIERHSEVFASLWKAKEGVACLKASAAIAHNLGDLDRVMDMWDLFVADPLRLRFYKLSAQPFDSNGKLRYLGRLWVAGQLYKSEIQGGSMSFENHRHFALRKPRCLRKDRSLMIHMAPFLDEWGEEVARFFAGADGTPSEETLEIVDALRSGWDRLPKTVGYGRALRGMMKIHPNLRIEDLTKSQRQVLEAPQDRFEKKWAEAALQEMDDIPSRA